jgi:tRNA nucleotidyltransferase/poly(A) polymerase
VILINFIAIYIVYIENYKMLSKNNMKFKNWLLKEEEQYHAMSASIPMPSEVDILSQLFKKFGAKLYAVGGAIRDYLYHIFHQKHIPYNPKDVDLATDQAPDQVIKILSSKEAIDNGIKVFPKGESFGVISAIINGKEFEIATFRTEFYDPEKGDGRRPDSVSYSTPSLDAKRRDLNINALFYDLDDKQIRDYNLDDKGEGEGFKDIRNLSVRSVGDPMERFREDKLRVLRLVRFFSRFNDDIITNHLDQKTISAVGKFKDLNGVSGERIANEFLSGLSKCKNVRTYMMNYKALGLLSTIFPGLGIDLSSEINSRDPIATMSFIFRNNDPNKLRSKLNELKYSNEISDTVAFILRVAYNLNKSNIIRMIRMRDNLSDKLRESFVEFGKISGLDDEIKYFLNYQQVTKSEDYMHLKGKEISDRMNDDEYNNYIKNSI